MGWAVSNGQIRTQLRIRFFYIYFNSDTSLIRIPRVSSNAYPYRIRVRYGIWYGAGVSVFYRLLELLLGLARDETTMSLAPQKQDRIMFLCGLAGAVQNEPRRVAMVWLTDSGQAGLERETNHAPIRFPKLELWSFVDGLRTARQPTPSPSIPAH